MAAGSRAHEGPCLIVLAAAHVQGAAEMFGERGALTDVVGMKMRTDDADHGLAAHVTVEQLAPQPGGFVVVETGVDDPPAVPIFEQIQVDVGQGTAHGHGQPAHARGDFHGLGGRRVRGIGILEFGGHGYSRDRQSTIIARARWRCCCSRGPPHAPLKVVAQSFGLERRVR